MQIGPLFLQFLIFLQHWQNDRPYMTMRQGQAGPGVRGGPERSFRKISHSEITEVKSRIERRT